jgi:effector-binding domain-containing protein
VDTEQNDNSVGIQQLEPQQVLIIRATARIEQLGDVVGDRIGALAEYLRQHDMKPAGSPFVRYHTFGETETDFELGVPVAQSVEPGASEGRIAAGELPGGPAVATWHIGPHNKLGDAYARIAQWLKEHGRAPDGPTWEVYHWIDLSTYGGAATLHDSAKWRTQLIQPIKRCVGATTRVAPTAIFSHHDPKGERKWVK